MIKKTFLFCLCFTLLIATQSVAANVPNQLLQAYCGSDVLENVLKSFSVPPATIIQLTKRLNASADKNKGYNSLYEISLAAKKANLKTNLVWADIETLRQLLDKGQLIANITGNRHFCIIRNINEQGVHVYIPGINSPEVIMPIEQFKATWDKAVLVIGKNKTTVASNKTGLCKLTKKEAQNIVGGQACSNVSGSSGGYSGSGGSGRWSSGNSAGSNNSDSSSGRNDPVTREPVVIRNGNLFLELADISIPTRSLALQLKRYYNSQIVSEVPGWIPEPGAGSWVIENGEYSGYGNRATSDLQVADFTLELDMQTIQAGSHYAWETGWINFRYKENPNDPRKALDCYYFLIHTNGTIELGKWKNGSQYFLFNKQSTYFPTYKNKIKIEAFGPNIKIYINGVLQINYTDSDPVLNAGRIALEAYFSHVHFDNCSITANSKNNFYNFDSDDNEFIFGYGWTHSYSLRIKEYDTHVTLFRENNSKEIFVPQGNGTYISVPANNYSTLTKDSNGFSLKTKSNVLYRFDLAGRLQYIQDKNNNRTNLSYINVGGKTFLSSIEEPAKRKITLVYGSNAMVSKIIDPQGNSLQYTYDSNNRLIKVIDRNGNQTSYKYDAISLNLIELTDPDGNIFKYNYTYNDRVNDQTDPLGAKTTFDYLWTTVHVINNRGETYKYNFDANQFLQSVSDPNNVMERSENDENGNVIAYYDKKNNKTTFTYDQNGNKLSMCDALGNCVKYTYDLSFNLPTSITDKRNNIANLYYDNAGNLLQSVNAEGAVSSFAYNTNGQIVSTTDARGNVTTFTYDEWGNLETKTDPLGNVTRYTYDVLGRLLKITDALGNCVENTYDKEGNLLSVKDPLGNITTYTYTSNGKLTSVTDPMGNITRYSYDCFGNLLTQTDAKGKITRYQYDTANQMHLNKANLLSIIDAKNQTTTYVYDSLDRLTKTIDAQNRTYQFSYDAQGNLASRKDSKNNTTTYSYDSLNRLSNINYPDSTTVKYTFDSDGNVVGRQDQTGFYSFMFDKISRLKSQSYPDKTTLTYTYDAANNRNSLDITGWGKIVYTYDELNRLISVTSPDAKRTSFSYDKISRREQLTFPNGAITTYSYDQGSRLLQLINKNPMQQVLSQFTYAYNKVSQKTQTSLINGTITYSYDSLHQLTQESSSINGQTSISQFNYDEVGNRISLNENSVITIYSYNNLNQLIQQGGQVAQKTITVNGSVSDTNPVTVKVNGVNAQVNNGTFSVNNIPLSTGLNTIRAQATDAAGNMNYHEIKVTNNEPASGSINYTYDNNGNLLSKGLDTFTYDSENRLKTFAGAGKNASYTYDGEGRRVSKTVNGITTQYYYDGYEVILEKTNGVSTYYLHGPRVDEIISDSRGYYYQTDGLGSIVSMTNSSGTIVNDYNYEAFGDLRNQNNAVSNPWLFTGRQFDSESGLYYYRNRYYDPLASRFITRDPIGVAGGLNLYGYCRNDPSNLIDPSGLDVVVLNDSDGAFGFGHIGVAIGNDSSGWDYFSQDGPSSGGGHHEFYNSHSELMQAQSIRYDRNYQINSNYEQDQSMRSTAWENLNNPYSANPFDSNRYNCADLVGDILQSGNINIGNEPIGNWPNVAFNNIINENPK